MTLTQAGLYRSQSVKAKRNLRDHAPKLQGEKLRHREGKNSTAASDLEFIQDLRTPDP